MKVLVVEDDKFYRLRVCEALADNHLDYASFSSLEEAVNLPFSEYSYAILDVALPNDPTKSGISHEESAGGVCAGLCLARLARKANPAIGIAFLTAGADSNLVQNWASENGAKIIAKDNAYTEFKTVLREIAPDRLKFKRKAFIVHGHDDAALFELKDFLQNDLNLGQPIVLREQANQGRTIIEKFEDYAEETDLVFVLLTPDDVARKFNTNDERRRARQNVVFELGYFYGKIGRSTGCVIALSKGGVELPSDIQGIIWIDIDKGIKHAGEEIRTELKALGI